jgi:vacuolar-type H+-ATPase subunit I/STV1
MFPAIPFVLLFQMLVVCAFVAKLPHDMASAWWGVAGLAVGIVATVVAAWCVKWARTTADSEEARVKATPDPSDDAVGMANAAALRAMADALERLEAGDVIGAMRRLRKSVDRGS